MCTNHLFFKDTAGDSLGRGSLWEERGKGGEQERRQTDKEPSFPWFVRLDIRMVYDGTASIVRLFDRTPGPSQ